MAASCPTDSEPGWDWRRGREAEGADREAPGARDVPRRYDAYGETGDLDIDVDVDDGDEGQRERGEGQPAPAAGVAGPPQGLAEAPLVREAGGDRSPQDDNGDPHPYGAAAAPLPPETTPQGETLEAFLGAPRSPQPSQRRTLSTHPIDDLIDLDYFFPMASAPIAARPPGAPPALATSSAPPADLERRMREELTCPICLDVFSDPRKLPCDHTFCHLCLGHLAAGEDQLQLRCPECRTAVPLGAPGPRGVALLPADRRVARLVCSFGERLEASAGGAGNGNEAEVLRDYVHVTRTAVEEEFQAFVPMSVTPYECIVAFESWKRSLWLTPRGFAEEASELLDVKAVFVPFFSFSLTTKAAWRGTVLVADPRRTHHNTRPRAPVAPTAPRLPPRLPAGDAAVSSNADDGDGAGPALSPSPVPEPPGATVPSWLQHAVGTTESFPHQPVGFGEARGVRGTATGHAWDWLRRAPRQLSAAWLPASLSGNPDDPLSVRAVVVGGRQENAYTDVLACGTHGVAAPLVQGLHASLDLDVDHLVPLPVFDPALAGPPPEDRPARGYARALEMHLLASLPSGPSRAPDLAVDPALDDDFAAVSWADVAASAPAGRRATSLAHLPPTARGVLTVDASPQSVWQRDVWPRVRACERDFGEGLLARNPLHHRVLEGVVTVSVAALDYRCLMVPFYTGHYRYGDRTYDVLVHGRTGQVSGQRPWLGGGALSTMQQYLKPPKAVDPT